MKTIAILLTFISLPALCFGALNESDHLQLNTAVKTNEVKTCQAPQSIVLLPGFVAQSGAVFQAAVGRAAPRSVVSVGQYGEELVRPIRLEPVAEPSDSKAEKRVNKP